MAYPRFQRARDFKFYNVGMQYSLTSTSWANINTGVDIVLSAQAGDVIEVQMDALWDFVNEFKFVDVATIVAGNPVNYFGHGSSEPSTGEGIRAWYGSGQTADYHTIGGGSIRELVAGDIENGQVRLRLRARGLSTTGRGLSVYRWWAKNLGPQDPN